MTRVRRTAALTMMTVLLMVGGGGAQSAPAATDTALARDIQRRFDVLPLSSGIALRPKATSRGVRSVELAGDTIAVDGVPVTGAELRAKLGADADLVLRLSYLRPEERLAALGLGRAAPAPPTAPSAPPASSEPPANAAPPAPQPPETPSAPRRHRSGAHVRFAGNVTVEPDEIADDSVIAIGGSVTVEGEVRGDVVSVGGSVTLGEKSDVSGDVTVVGGALHRAPGARVGGKVNEIGLGAVDLDGRRYGRGFSRRWVGGRVGSGVALMSTVTRIAVLCLLACLVVLVGGDYVARVGARAAHEPLKAGAIGLLAQLLFLPLLVISVIVLVITIVGIPLLVLVPFALLAIAVVFLVGFTAVAARVGALLASKFGWTGLSPYMTTIVGILAVMSPIVVARTIGLAGGLVFPMTLPLTAVGLLFEYAAWTIGFGAVALMRLNTPPPPPPATAVVSPG